MASKATIARIVSLMRAVEASARTAGKRRHEIETGQAPRNLHTELGLHAWQAREDECVSAYVELGRYLDLADQGYSDKFLKAEGLDFGKYKYI